MTKSLDTNNLPGLDVKMAGVHFRSPIGVAAIARHFGKDTPQNQEQPGEADARVLLKHIEAGAGYIYVNGFFVTEDTQKRLIERSRWENVHCLQDGMRAMKAETPVAPYGVEGIYYHVIAPFWIKAEQSVFQFLKLHQTYKHKFPNDTNLKTL